MNYFQPKYPSPLLRCRKHNYNTHIEPHPPENLPLNCSTLTYFDEDSPQHTQR